MRSDLPAHTPLPSRTADVGLAPVRRSIHVALAVAAVAVAAQLAVPIPGTPVPVSLQDLAVLMIGVVLGPTVGAGALVAYLGLGALGAPVFSNGHGGFPWLLGATGGYLLAYPVACWIMGAAARRPRGVLAVLAGALLAQAVVYVGGVTQLLLLTSQDLGAAVALGVVPFLPGVALKTGLLVAFVVALDRLGPGGRSAGAGTADRTAA